MENKLQQKNCATYALKKKKKKKNFNGCLTWDESVRYVRSYVKNQFFTLHFFVGLQIGCIYMFFRFYLYFIDNFTRYMA